MHQYFSYLYLSSLPSNICRIYLSHLFCYCSTQNRKMSWYVIICYHHVFSVPEVPGSLKLVMISVTSLNVSWTPPVIPNGIITKYEVSYHLMSNVIGKLSYF